MPSKAKATSLSKASLKNIIKISIGDRKKRRRRRRRKTLSQQQQQQQQQQPQVVVVNQAPPPDPYKRESSVQLSALERNLENAVKTQQAGRRLGSRPQVPPARDPVLFSPPLSVSTQSPQSEGGTGAGEPPTPRGRHGSFFNLSPLNLSPLQSPNESQEAFPLDQSFGFGSLLNAPTQQQLTATTPLQPDTRLSHPPLSPGDTPMTLTNTAFNSMLEYVLRHTSDFPRGPSGQQVPKPAVVRKWTVEKNFGRLQSLYNHVKSARDTRRGGGGGGGGGSGGGGGGTVT